MKVKQNIKFAMVERSGIKENSEKELQNEMGLELSEDKKVK